MTGIQGAALLNLNQLGARALEGQRWAFEFGAGCVLRVSRRFEGRLAWTADTAMQGRSVDVVRYAVGGYGLKAVAARAGGSLDVLDAQGEAAARDAADALRRLLAGCNGPALALVPDATDPPAAPAAATRRTSRS